MKLPYLLVPIGLATIIAYMGTLLLSKAGVISKKTHRRLWNVALLLTFLVTAILGLVLAIQVNYKISMPWLEDMLTLHVDFGIAMSLVAVFHFLWHLDYYWQIIKPVRKRPEGDILTIEKPSQPHVLTSLTYNPASIYLHLFLLGMVSTLVQIIMMREFMFVFGGNELIVGIMLANWMILTGLGAALGGKMQNSLPDLPVNTAGMNFLGWTPVILIALLNLFRNRLFKPGLEIGFIQVIMGTFVFMAPFCLFSGFLFSGFTGKMAGLKQKQPGEKAYALEAAGSVLAGMLTSFVFIYLLSNFQTALIIPVCCSLLFLVPLSRDSISFKTGVLVPVVTTAIVLLLFVIQSDYRLKKAIFRNQEVLFMKDTPFGNLSVTRSADQLNIYDNGKLMFSTDNQMGNEEAVHFAMAQHPGPRQVLLISGGISGITHEILKYNVENIDYVEINPALFTIGKQYTNTLDDHRITIIGTDARNYLQQTKHLYDVVLVNMPEPSTAQLNRYYTLEFLEQTRKILRENGIIVLSLPPTVNYISDAALKLNAAIYMTCREVFRVVRIIPGERNYFLASDHEIAINITHLIEKKNIKTDYLNSYYIDEASLSERSAELTEKLETDAMINRDFRPVTYFYYLNYWLSQHNLAKGLLWWIFAGIISVLLLICLVFKPVTSSLMIAGFSASALEIILLLMLQIVSGYIYQLMGLCFAVFMAGLALGALFRHRFWDRVNPLQFSFLLALTGVLSLVVPLLIKAGFMPIGSQSSIIIILILILILSAATGVLFSMGIQLRSGNTVDNVSVLYGADLLGSALGALIASLFLVPLLGLSNACYIVGIIVIGYAVYPYMRIKSGWF